RGAAKSAGPVKTEQVVVAVGAATAAPGRTQGDMFAGTGDDVSPDELPFGANAEPAGGGWKADYRLANERRVWQGLLKPLKTQRRFAIDRETTGLEPRRSDIVGYAFSWKEGEGYYVAVRGPECDTKLDPDAVLKELKPILEDPAIQKVNQNIKYDQI